MPMINLWVEILLPEMCQLSAVWSAQILKRRHSWFWTDVSFLFRLGTMSWELFTLNLPSSSLSDIQCRYTTFPFDIDLHFIHKNSSWKSFCWIAQFADIIWLFRTWVCLKMSLSYYHNEFTYILKWSNYFHKANLNTTISS